MVSDHLSDVLFAPTKTAVDNLLHEGLEGPGLHLTGDVMYDAAIEFATIAEEKSEILERLRLEPGAFVLATIHRPANTDDPRRLEAILRGLEEVALSIQVIMPMHPRVRAALGEATVKASRLTAIQPVGYFDMVQLERHAAVIATDSGGVQKEAFFYGIPCVTLREETEWVELIELGWNRLRLRRMAVHFSRGIHLSVGFPRPRR